jgi:hypothetical protein
MQNGKWKMTNGKWKMLKDAIPCFGIDADRRAARRQPADSVTAGRGRYVPAEGKH